MQSKLLRAIQERSVRPVGAVTEEPVDVRIAERHAQGPGAEVQAGRFRQDLYYRLNVIQIRVPPLRERLEDLPALCSSRCSSASRATPASGRRRGCRATRCVHLSRYPFPGNVRELENLLHRAVALSGGEELDVDDLGLPESVFADSAAQELDQIAPARRRRDRSGAPAADDAGRAAAAERPRRATSTRSSATSWSARSSTTASTAPRPGTAWACRCARCATAWRGWDVNVGGDSASADRE